MKQYKIGEFSKYLGVTPDFIKYYEQFDLIFPNINEGKVKTYDFNNASKVIECMRLKNQGLSVKEIRQHLTKESLICANEDLSKKMEEMKQKIEYEVACVKNYEEMQKWIQDHNKDEKNSWTIFKRSEQVFLKHTIFDEFVAGDHVQEAMKSWIKWLPMVHSCRYIRLQDQNVEELNWGFMVSRDFLDEHHLILNDACVKVESCRVFCYSFYDAKIEGLEKNLEDALKIIHALKLEITGDVYEEVFAYTNVAGNAKKSSEFYFILK